VAGDTAEGLDRGQVDDAAAAPAFDHPRQHRLGDGEDVLEVDRPLSLPGRGVLLDEDGRRLQEVADVVDQHVGLGRRRRDPRRRACRGDVELQRLQVRRPDPLAQRGERLTVVVDGEHRGAVGEERLGHRATDPGGAAGDDRVAARQQRAGP
jgi:hypothetical protein